MNSIQELNTAVLRLVKLKIKLGMSGSSIYNKLNPSSRYFDPTFPKPIKLGASAVGWIEAEIDEWILSCVKASRPETIE